MGRAGCLSAALVQLIMVACCIPVYDRAEIMPGPSFLIGAGAGTGLTVSGYSMVGYPFFLPYLDYYLDGIGTMRLGYGFNRKLGLVLEGSLGYGIWPFGPANAPFESLALKPLIYEINLGLKIKTGRKGALVPSIGTGILDISFLYDFNRFYSGNFGIGARGGGGRDYQNRLFESGVETAYRRQGEPCLGMLEPARGEHWGGCSVPPRESALMITIDKNATGFIVNHQAKP